MSLNYKNKRHCAESSLPYALDLSGEGEEGIVWKDNCTSTLQSEAIADGIARHSARLTRGSNKICLHKEADVTQSDHERAHMYKTDGLTLTLRVSSSEGRLTEDEGGDETE